ncbi:lysophospholipid acyltransferase family protein [Jonquetella anthropi]|uniref:lysophospholipid acyltransferase family protein n=1 Tax=Jonquetella anthropi TaxID=428712 RepID=UPI0023F16252|nr:lysophospholipid acyltransferase family protein [Jonquetella anthropi]
MTLATGALKLFRRWVGDGSHGARQAAFLKGLCRLVPVRRKEALKAITLSFPEKTPEECRRILDGVYDHFCWMIVEWVACMNRPGLVNEIFECSPDDLAKIKSYAGGGKGVVVLCAHFGNWELGGAWMAAQNLPLLCVAREADDGAFSDLITAWRDELGVKTLMKSRSRSFLRLAVQTPRQGVSLALLADQDGGRNGQEVTFLGRPCTAVRGPALISLLAGVPVLPLYALRLGPFRYKVVLEEPLAVDEKLSKEEKIAALTEAANRSVEQLVRRYPEQWFWFHRRWKSGLSRESV